MLSILCVSVPLWLEILSIFNHFFRALPSAVETTVRILS